MQASAARVQAAARGIAARRRVTAMVVAAVHIQARGRGLLTRRAVELLHHQAAIMLQTRWRGVLGRKECLSRLEIIANAAADAAAIEIQSAIR